MCLLIVLREMIPDWPLVMAANREEHYDRLGEPPQLLCENPKVFGGRDPHAGGTWLAVNQWAMVCAVTNRPRTEPPPGEARSRGLLALDAACQKSPIAVADLLGRALAENQYNGFNLFCSTPADGRIFYFDGRLREKPLASGLFILTTSDANDPSSAKIRRVRERLEPDRPRPLAAWIERLEAICRDHAGAPPGRPDAPCMHGEKGGTISSSILAFHGRDLNLHLFRHCQGRPCEAPYQPVPWPSGFFVRSSESPG